MTKRVLIVHPDKDMILVIEELLDEIRESEGYDLSWSHAKTQRDAEHKAGPGKPLELIVTSLEIPEDNKPSAGAGEQHRRGLKLIRDLLHANPGMAAILITGQADNEVVAFTQSERVGLVQEGAGFKDQLEAEIARHLGSHKPETPRRVDLEISLSTDQGCSCRFHKGGRTLFEGPLDVDRARLRHLVEDSRDVRVDNHRWEKDLRLVGEALADELFQPTPANLAFRDKFHELKGNVGIENIRVRFAVQDTLHPIAVEALKRRHEDEDSWMLQTAVYRGQRPHTDGRGLEPRGLFQDEQTRDQPINFLIIEADVPNKVIVSAKDLDLKLNALPNLKKEVTAVGTLLSDLKKEGRPMVGKVRMIKKETVPAGSSFQKHVEDVLQEGAWHIVHYAGHTYYDFQHQVGYLFFPGSDGGLEPVRIDLFAHFLSKADTRFVFLSSCEGAQQDFIYHLAKERIPAIMGFLWNVGDAKAGEYAESFYRHLLGGKERSLEYACLEAKKEMHAKYEENPIWASPVLVMQVGV
jgi:hypothetical protein